MPRNIIAEKNILKLLLASQLLSTIKSPINCLQHLKEIDIPCDPEDLEDCQRIKSECTILKFRSRRKSSEVPLKKKKLKTLMALNSILTQEQVIYK